MDRKERLSKILDRINARWANLFEWLTCEDLGRDWDGVGNPYNKNCQNNKKIVGRDTDSDPQSS